MKNQDIRQEAKKRGVRLWQIAEGFGVSDSSFSRKLRHEFSDQDRMFAFKQIDLIAEGGEEDD